MEEKKTSLKIGKIVATHALKGEVSLVKYSDDNLALYKNLYLNKTPVKVTENGYKKNLTIIKIAGINNIEQAKKLIGMEFSTKRSYMPPIKNNTNTFYNADLKGLTVVDKDDLSKEYGVVVDTYNFNNNVMLEIKIYNDKQLILVPFVKQYFPKIDLKKKIICAVDIQLFIQ